MLKRRRLALAVSALMLLAGIGLIGYAVTRGKSEPQGFNAPQSFTAPTATRIFPTTVPTAQPTPEPTPEPSRADVQRLVIPKIGIDAPIVHIGVDNQGVMQSPSGLNQVGWYDPDMPNKYAKTENLGFSNHPGWNGNTVFAAHVFLDKQGRAVFYRLRELQAGDEVTVRLEDGVAFNYRVISRQTYDAETISFQEILGAKENEIITLITCAGDVIPGTLELDQRLVVHAERIPDQS